MSFKLLAILIVLKTSIIWIVSRNSKKWYVSFANSPARLMTLNKQRNSLHKTFITSVLWAEPSTKIFFHLHTLQASPRCAWKLRKILKDLMNSLSDPEQSLSSRMAACLTQKEEDSCRSWIGSSPNLNFTQELMLFHLSSGNKQTWKIFSETCQQVMETSFIWTKSKFQKYQTMFTLLNNNKSQLILSLSSQTLPRQLQSLATAFRTTSKEWRLKPIMKQVKIF